MLGLVTAALRGVTRPGRTDRGLYAGSRIFFGNKISKDKKSPSKCAHGPGHLAYTHTHL